MALFQQAEQQMEQTVQSLGLTLNVHHTIYSRAQADPDLAAHIQSELQQIAE